MFTEKLREYHLNLRENFIKSGKSKPSYNEKWRRFLPSQRYNVDQVPLPFVLDKLLHLSLSLNVFLLRKGCHVDEQRQHAHREYSGSILGNDLKFNKI